MEPSAVRTAVEALVAEDHLSDEDLDILIDERVEHPAHLAISEHVESCAMCRAEVEDLRGFGQVPDSDTMARRWLIAAAFFFAVLALSAIALWSAGFRRRLMPVVSRAIASDSATSERAAARDTSASLSAGSAASAGAGRQRSQKEAPRVVASLADGGSRIALLEDGTIEGVELQSPRDAEDARVVLSGRSIAIPTFIAAMPGAVRGSDAGKHPLRAVEPFRSAVRVARPRFSWTPVRDASSYRVAVFDADYEEIAQSEALQGTSWTPSKPLPAGVDYSWHVVAETAAGELSSAGSDRGEAVFRVLTPKETAAVDLGETHYRDSHLLRGLLYSRHGLLHDAEREFRRLAEQNPDSPIARALIDSVSR